MLLTQLVFAVRRCLAHADIPAPVRIAITSHYIAHTTLLKDALLVVTNVCICDFYRRHRDRVVRRGIGMVIESDFYSTEAGRSHFQDQLTSIRCEC